MTKVPQLALNLQERAILEPIEVALFAAYARPITVDYLVGRWEEHIRDIEAGYEGGVDDYTYELSHRDDLERLLQEVPLELRMKLDRIVAPLDERFRQLTRPDEDNHLRHYFRHGPNWWWLRLPINLGKMAYILIPWEPE